MDTFRIEITTDGKWVSIDFDPRMPFILADEIKNVVKDFYKED